jgi:hypothetical protein
MAQIAYRGIFEYSLNLGHHRKDRHDAAFQ